MIKRLQRWLGSGAPIDTSPLLISIFGCRHEDCDLVHRSWDSWVDCMLRIAHEEFMAYQAKLQEFADRVGYKTPLRDPYADGTIDASIARARSLRPLL